MTQSNNDQDKGSTSSLASEKDEQKSALNSINQNVEIEGIIDKNDVF